MSLIRIISTFFVLFSFAAFGQIKGKAKNLVGTWKYNQGSGYETWILKEGKLIGEGYRMTKIGDSVKVEDLTISMVNKNLIYELETKQGTVIGDTNTVHRFIGNKRKLFFENINDDIPLSIKYRFGFFNKKKLVIFIQFKDGEKSQKLRLTKIKV